MAELRPRINFITLGVHDMVSMRAFYERLGFKVSGASNANVTFFDAGGVVLGLFGSAELAHDAAVAAREPGREFKGFTLAWNATSESHADAVLAHAVTQGATLKKPAQKVFWGGYSGYFADPEGNLWEVAYNHFAELDERMQIRLP